MFCLVMELLFANHLNACMHVRTKNKILHACKIVDMSVCESAPSHTHTHTHSLIQFGKPAAERTLMYHSGTLGGQG